MQSTVTQKVLGSGDSSGTNEFKPRAFSLDDKLAYCDVTVTTNLEPNSLESNDMKMLSKSFVKHIHDDRNSPGPWAKITNSKFLDNSNGFMKREHGAVIISWYGKGQPPETLKKLDPNWVDTLKPSEEDPPEVEIPTFGPRVGQSEFERVWNQEEGRRLTGKLGWHWNKVEFYNHHSKKPASYEVSKDLLHKLQTLFSNQASGELNFKVVYVPLELQQVRFTLRDLFRKNSSSPAINGVMCIDIERALLKKEYNGRPEVPVHGNRIFDLGSESKDPKEDFRGLTLCIGNQRHIGANKAGQPLLFEGSFPGLFFKREITVADFLLEHWGKNLSKVDLGPKNQEFNDRLVGKFVKFRAGSGFKTKAAIHSVSKIATEDATDDQKHPYWRSKTGWELAHPELPCIAVGSKPNQMLMPASLCQIVDGQSFARPHAKNVRNDAQDKLQQMTKSSSEDHKPAHQHRLGRAGFVVQLKMPERNTRKVKLDELVQETLSKDLQIGFIEVGSETVKGDVWHGLKRYLAEVNSASGQTTNVHIKEEQSLFLLHQRDTDNSTTWRRQLQVWKERIFGASSKVVAVVIVNDHSPYAEIYKLLKNLGETGVDIQTYFLKAKVLEAKAKNDRNDGAEMAAYEVARRMASRNMPLKLLKEGDSYDVVVAVHIESIVVHEPSIDALTASMKSSAQCQYVVSIVARHAVESNGYRTHVELVTKDDLIHYDVAGAIRKVLDTVKWKANVPHRITVLRSGHLPASFASEAKNATPGQLEVSSVSKISYIYLSEGPPSTLLTRSDWDQIVTDQGQPTFFATGAKSITECRIGGKFVQIHRPQSTNESETQAASPTVINVQIYGSDLVSKPDTSSTAKPKKKLGTKAVSVNGDDSSNGSSRPAYESVSTADTSETPATSNMASELPTILPTELQRLSCLWIDESLNLYNTKFPAVTHLAKLAAKRAQAHIIKGRFNDQGDDYLPCKLAEVKPEVAKTLYYL